LGWFFFGLPPTKLHRNFANEPSRFDHGQIGLGVADAGVDLALVADDAGVLEQLLELGRAVARDLGGIEIVVNLAVVLALAQHRDPRRGPPGSPRASGARTAPGRP
jgi:hypothetical protein